MSPNQVIVLAMPVFLLLIAVEFAVGLRRGRNTYALADTLSSIGLGMLSRVADVFTLALRLGIYVWVQDHAALWSDDGFWTSPAGWLLALVFYDFLYYWNHRIGHEVGVFWAAHVVHHQSQHYNLSTALRQPASYALLGWVFYLPMALAGVPPLVFAVVGLVDLLYQFWIHTEQIGSLGRFDRWFASPSNHRVHHAVNDRYLDRNYGGMLMLWDHLFGTFEPEGSGRTLCLRHPQTAAELGPGLGQCRGLRRAGPRQRARETLERQATHLAQATRMAPSRRSGALAGAAVRDRGGTPFRTARLRAPRKRWQWSCSWRCWAASPFSSGPPTRWTWAARSRGPPA